MTHPLYDYFNWLKSLQNHIQLETFFGFRDFPSTETLPEFSLPSPASLEEIPTYFEPESSPEAIFVTEKSISTSPQESKQGVSLSRLSPEIKKSGLAQLEQQVAKCTACRLASTRSQTVFGYGNPNAKLVFIGEAPGADEDRQGIPFVGKAGQLLTRIIESIHMTREEIYLMNLIKCRPPGNREPKADEIELCRSFFLSQLNYLDPKIICTLGKFASQNLLNTTLPISRLRGEVFYWNSIPVIPTFHPSYLLRNESEKRKVWEDMKKIRDLLEALQEKNKK
ncbi:MAG: uracil-DNA glycosylase [Planctomycetota bacterium]